MRFFLLLALALVLSATAWPIPTLTLLGDVPPPPIVSADILATLPHWLQVVLVVLGAVVPTFSLLAALINAYVRAARARDERVPTWMLAVAGVVNVPALNPDKSVEAVKVLNAQAAEVKP